MEQYFCKKRGACGQVLIEAMVAMTIAIVGLLGILTLTNRSFALMRTVTFQYVGANLAAEGIELVKDIINRNYARITVGQTITWANGIFSGNNFCVDYNDAGLADCGSVAFPKLQFDPATGLYSHDAGGTPTFFQRSIAIDTDPDGNTLVEQIKVVSRVTWQSRGQQFEVKVEDRFFDWLP